MKEAPVGLQLSASALTPQTSRGLTTIGTGGQSSKTRHRRLEQPPTVQALEQIARLRGGSQAQVMRCSNGHYYVVKFANNPQGEKILFNELLAHRLAGLLQLPIPPCAIVDVPTDLIRLTENLHFETPTQRVPCRAGLAFGSQLRTNAFYAWKARGVPIINTGDFLGMLILDKWTCNRDARQALLISRGRRFRLEMIDNGFCFGGNDWNFKEAPLGALFYDRSVYPQASEIGVFEPWLARLERQIDCSILLECARCIPKEWYADDWPTVMSLLRQLDERRLQVREMILKTLVRIEEIAARENCCWAKAAAAN